MMTKRVRANQSFDRLIPYWKTAHPTTFPNLHANTIGWGEPFCFRCGWLVPLRHSYGGNWNNAGPWLELCHLQDFALGGSDEPANVVPLCTICHRSMPRLFADRADAVVWVRSGQPNACPWWWQEATDDRWGGKERRPFPGASAFLRFYQATNERAAVLMRDALSAAYRNATPLELVSP